MQVCLVLLLFPFVALLSYFLILVYARLPKSARSIVASIAVKSNPLAREATGKAVDAGDADVIISPSAGIVTIGDIVGVAAGVDETLPGLPWMTFVGDAPYFILCTTVHNIYRSVCLRKNDCQCSIGRQISTAIILHHCRHWRIIN